jgi:hypothetical protein
VNRPDWYAIAAIMSPEGEERDGGRDDEERDLPALA